MSVSNAAALPTVESIQALDAKGTDPELDVANTIDDVPPVAPDQFDPRFESTRNEIWSYYSYYVGNNGLSLLNFAPTAFQDLLYLEAGDAETLRFLGATRTINSIVLLANGISFAIQVVLFLIIGSLADYGTWRPWILVFWSIVAFGLGFGWLGVHETYKWPVATGMYMVGLIAYQMCITFWTAAFPGLARNTAEMRMKAEEYENRQCTRDEYDFADMMQRNRISNVSFIMQSAGEIIILAILVGILFALKVDDSDQNNLWGLSVTIAYTTGVWVLFSIPWFLLEKRRPGQQLPPGMNYVSVGFWQLYRAFTQIWRLKQSFLYLIGYFILGDSLNTTITVIYTLQNSVVQYNTLTLAYLYIVGIAAQLVGIWGFWTIQKRFGLSTKVMFDVIMIGIILLDGWGMIGIWTSKFGFHNVWEFWVFQTYYGLIVCPWYSYSQIMISEVTPRGKEFLFFSLFSIMGKTSAFIGPIVSSAIIDASASKNNSLPFYFLIGLSIIAFLLLFFGVNLKKSRIEQELFLEDERRIKERRASVISFKRGSIGGVASSGDSASGIKVDKAVGNDETNGNGVLRDGMKKRVVGVDNDQKIKESLDVKGNKVAELDAGKAFNHNIDNDRLSQEDINRSIKGHGDDDSNSFIVSGLDYSSPGKTDGTAYNQQATVTGRNFGGSHVSTSGNEHIVHSVIGGDNSYSSHILTSGGGSGNEYGSHITTSGNEASNIVKSSGGADSYIFSHGYTHQSHSGTTNTNTTKTTTTSHDNMDGTGTYYGNGRFSEESKEGFMV